MPKNIEERERNYSLISDYLETTPEGKFLYTLKELGIKYARVTDSGEFKPLTRQRIYQILEFYGVPKNRIDIAIAEGVINKYERYKEYREHKRKEDNIRKKEKTRIRYNKKRRKYKIKWKRKVKAEWKTKEKKEE